MEREIACVVVVSRKIDVLNLSLGNGQRATIRRACQIDEVGLRGVGTLNDQS